MIWSLSRNNLVEKFENIDYLNTKLFNDLFNSLKIIKSLDHSKIRLGKNGDGGYVILDGLNYDLLIGCGISNDDSFEHAFLEKYKNFLKK